MTARSDTWMPMYWGDYARDTGNLNNAGHGAYLMLIKHYWCTGGPLSDDDDELWRTACCDSKTEWMKLRAKIVRLFIVEDGMLRHKRVDREIAKTSAISLAKADAGRKGAERRWQNDGAAIAEPSIRDGTPMARAIAEPSVCQWQNDAPSQSPLPRKKEPDLRSVVQTDEFDGFWALYPRKVGKDAARKEYARTRKHAEAGDIFAGLRRYAFSPDPRYQPHASTWLHEGRWHVENDTPPPNLLGAEPPTERTVMNPLGLTLSKSRSDW